MIVSVPISFFLIAKSTILFIMSETFNVYRIYIYIYIYIYICSFVDNCVSFASVALWGNLLDKIR